MASHNVPDEVFIRTLRTLEDCGGKKSAAARVLGVSHTTISDHILSAERRGLTAKSEPFGQKALQDIIEGLRLENDKLRADLKMATRPVFRVPMNTAVSAEKIRLVCIGDAHDSPAIPDKSRFRWIGRYIAKVKPDVVLQIGDFATMDSLNTHVPDETYHGKAKPTFMADMVSLNEALGEMNIPDGIEKHCTLGNHERRLYLFEDQAPASFGMMQCELQKLFERYKWTFSPYGQISYFGGVGFVHAALNRLGKTYGGKTAENTIGNDAVHDLVIGHSHVRRSHKAPKIGGNNYVQVFNVGCALPQDFIEEYATHSLTGWSYGIADFTIQRGHIQNDNWISMGELEERYGSKG